MVCECITDRQTNPKQRRNEQPEYDGSSAHFEEPNAEFSGRRRCSDSRLKLVRLAISGFSGSDYLQMTAWSDSH